MRLEPISIMQLLYQNNSPYNVYGAAIRMLAYMERCELDSALAKWKDELAEANEALMERMIHKSKPMGLKEQTRALLRSIVSIRRLVESCLYSDDAKIVEHAKAVEQVLKRYVGFGRMNIARKMTKSELLLLDLTDDDMKPHVEATPRLSELLTLLRQAREDIMDRRMEMVKNAVEAKNKLTLQPLKQNVAKLMNNIGAYLEAMTLVDAEAYEPILKVFRRILEEQDEARRRAIKRKRKKQAEQEVTTIEMPQKEDKEVNDEVVETE